MVSHLNEGDVVKAERGTLWRVRTIEKPGLITLGRNPDKNHLLEATPGAVVCGFHMADIIWASATRSTASTGSSSRSRGGPRGSCGRSSTHSAHGCRRCGPTPTSWPRSVAHRWGSSSSTWRTSATPERPYLPTAKAGGFSGGLR